jgi:hypothetical protein
MGNALWAASAFTAEIESGYRINPQSHLLIEEHDLIVAVIVEIDQVPLPAACALIVVMPALGADEEGRRQHRRAVWRSEARPASGC